MSGCSQQTFNGVTQARWDCIKTAVQTRTGVVITTDSGTAKQGEFSINWNFDAATEVLTIQCMEKPFILPCAAIESTINHVVNSCP